MAEKGFEYTIEEASALMEEIGKLSLPQFLSINKTLSENKRRTLIDHLKCTEEEFEKLLELIIDIRGL